MFQDNKAIAYATLRLAMGINLFGHGFFRILSGVGAFANGMAESIAKGPLPHALSLGYGYCIPWIELTLGTLLLLGLFTRFALTASALFIVTLTFGTASVQNWQTAGGQLLYSLVFFFLLWHVEANTLSVDGILGRRSA
jgi:thiosulfate dehydrogenase [quinone] large subunit